MKKGVYLAGGLMIGIILGWTAGYLRVPLVTQAAKFWGGVLAGASLVFLGLLVRSLWRQPWKDLPVSLRIGTFLALFLVSGSMLGAWFISKQNRSLQAKYGKLKQKVATDSLMGVKQIQLQQADVMVSLLDDVREALANTAGKSLSDEMINRLARLSDSFSPYPVTPPSADSVRQLSPERARLLLNLLSIEMDEGIFTRIKKKVSFAQADLQDAYLPGIDLSDADLRGANFWNATLDSVKCQDCNLHLVDFSRAKANAADFTGANMRRAIFHYTEAHGIVLRHTILDGADMSDAVMEMADLGESRYQWGEMKGANLAGASIVHVDFKKTGMKQVNFSKADLTESSLRLTQVQQANFQDAILINMSVVEPNWVDALTEWAVSGSADIQGRYEVIPDTVVRYHNSKFVLTHRTQPAQSGK